MTIFDGSLREQMSGRSCAEQHQDQVDGEKAITGSFYRGGNFVVTVGKRVHCAHAN
jgi:hypothetical protein